MTPRQRVFAMLPWYSMALIFILGWAIISFICRATLLVGLVPLWTVFVLAAMLCLVKGYAEFLGPRVGEQSIG